MGLNRIVNPTSEPVTVAEMRDQVNITFTADDNRLALYIASARRTAENILGRALITQTWELTLDAFPEAIRLDYPPIIAVTSLKYLESTAGALTTLDPACYVVDTKSHPGWIMPAYGYTWPSTYDTINAVIVTYNAGYGSASAVPENVKHWICVRAADAYANREVLVPGRMLTAVPYLDGLLDECRVMQVA